MLELVGADVAYHAGTSLVRTKNGEAAIGVAGVDELLELVRQRLDGIVALNMDHFHIAIRL